MGGLGVRVGFTTYLKSVIGCVNGALSVPSAMEVRGGRFSRTTLRTPPSKRELKRSSFSLVLSPSAVSQLFRSPAPLSPLRQLSVRLRREDLPVRENS